MDVNQVTTKPEHNEVNRERCLYPLKAEAEVSAPRMTMSVGRMGNRATYMME